MPTVSSNGIRIAFEDYGKPGDPVLLLVQGFATSSGGWPPALIHNLVAAGFRVITPDNRDAGQSEQMDTLGTGNFLAQFIRRAMFLNGTPPYDLTDMMRDMIGLLDALSIEQANVVGTSMGGMISQLMAIHEPTRVRTLTTIMSSTGRRGLPGPTAEIRRQLRSGPAAQTPAAREDFMRTFMRLLAGPQHPMSDEELGQLLFRLHERGATAAGARRHMLAVMAAPSRVKLLQKLDLPVQVIHGTADPFVPVECGRDIATTVHGATLNEIAGWGHDYPRTIVPKLTELIVRHASRT